MVSGEVRIIGDVGCGREGVCVCVCRGDEI